jgi:hypothetical protein
MVKPFYEFTQSSVTGPQGSKQDGPKKFYESVHRRNETSICPAV